MKISAKEARKRFSEILNLVSVGEEILITRRGNVEAKLIRHEEKDQAKKKKRFPDLTAFRESIEIKGEPLSETVIRNREEERY